MKLNAEQRWHVFRVVHERMNAEERKELTAKAVAAHLLEVDYVMSLYAAHRKELTPLWFPEVPAR